MKSFNCSQLLNLLMPMCHLALCMLPVQSITSAMLSIPSTTPLVECLETSSLVPAVSQMIIESIYQPMHSSTTCE